MPQLTIEPWIVFGTDLAELRHLKSEIFSQDLYYVDLATFDPVIIDLGAHIGMATLYYKKFFPQAKIWGVEPHPQSFALLEENVTYNRLDDVHLLNNAVWTKSDQLLPLHEDLEQTWLSTTSILENAWNEDQPSQPLGEVATVSLPDLLSLVSAASGRQTIDILKIDIEGAEDEVMKDIFAHHPTALNNVEHLFLEHHPFKGALFIHKLVENLQKIGFKKITLYKNNQQIKVHQATGLVLIEANRH